MSKDYGIVPPDEHSIGIIDLFGSSQDTAFCLGDPAKTFND